jgi:hypothetical protein
MTWELPYYSIKPQSIGQLGALVHRVLTHRNQVFECDIKFLRPYCVACLDQVIRNRKIPIRIRSSDSKVNQYLEQCGFEFLDRNAAVSEPFAPGMIIPLHRFKGRPIKVESVVVKWIEEGLLPFMPDLSRGLRKLIVENFWEIVNNAITHSSSKTGVSACGQFYPRMGYFEIAFADYGSGIPDPVRDFTKKRLSDQECIAWSVEEGHSTRPFKESAGLGLHLLREFLTVNRGTFQIISGYGYFGQDAEAVRKITSLSNKLPGTLVNIRVIYDNRLYIIKDHHEND